MAMPDLERLPRCCKCGYIVLGISGTICPECGSDLREVGLRQYKTSKWRSVGLRLLMWTILVSILVLLVEPALRSTIIKYRVLTTDSVQLAPASGKYDLYLTYQTEATEYALVPQRTRQFRSIDLTTRLNFKATRDYWTLKLHCMVGIAVDPDFRGQPRRIDADSMAAYLCDELNRRPPNPAEQREGAALAQLFQLCRKQPLRNVLSTMRNSSDWPFTVLPGSNTSQKHVLEQVTSGQVIFAGCVFWAIGAMVIVWRPRRHLRASA